MRKISSNSATNNKPIMNQQGMLITSKDEQTKVWKQHFERILNADHPNDTEELYIEHRLDSNGTINVNVPTTNDINAAICKLKNGKAPGIDTLPADCFKANSEAVAEMLTPLFQKVWETEIIPAEWKESVIIKLLKKGDPKVCTNWRGISIIPAITKIFNQIILDRIADHLNAQMSRTQAGFMPNRSCVDHVNTLRAITEQSLEYNSPLYVTFIDFEKAFDSVRRDFLWTALEARGIPGKIIRLIKNTYDNATYRVQHAGLLSEPFTTTSGVKQGCSLSPILFITALDIVFEKVNQRPRGITWKLNQKLGELIYADDVALLADNHSDMQLKLTTLADTARKIGLKINLSKTKCMRLKTNNITPLYLDETAIEDVTEFEYLGSKIGIDGGANADVESRIRKARNSFRMLGRIWRSNTIRINTKIVIFNACVKSVLLYGSETWHMSRSQTHKLQTLTNRCLRTLLKIWWPRTISNNHLWNRTGQEPIECEIKKRKYGWIGHTLRKDEGDIAHTCLTWNPQGSRRRGRPRSSWRRTIIGETGKSMSELRFIARNRDNWKRFVNSLL